MNRNCQKCIHHISGNCDAWGCEMQTLEDYRNKVIDEFAERLKKLYQAYDIDLCLQDNDHLNYTDSRIALESYIDEIAEQLKGE